MWGYIDRKKLTGFSNNEKQYTKLEALGLAVVIGGPLGAAAAVVYRDPSFKWFCRRGT